MKSNMVPKASPDALPELAAFLEPFAPLFRRHTSRDSLERYLTGLLTDLPHKTADTIAAAVAGTSTERLQHLLTDAAWDAQALDEARVKRLLAIHPPTSGGLVFDETGLPKKGSESVGVAAQYSGTLSKIGNCQVVVSAEYLADDPASSTPFHWPVSAQLYLPEPWITDDERRKRTHVPAEIGQQTKPEIALSLLDRAQVVAIRVHWATGSPRHSTSHSRVRTGPEGWLLAERPVAVPVPKSQELSTTEPVPPDDTAQQEAAGEHEADETKYWFSTLPPD